MKEKMEKLKALIQERKKLEAEYQGTDTSAIHLEKFFQLQGQIKKDMKLSKKIDEIKQQEFKLLEEIKSMK